MRHAATSTRWRVLLPVLVTVAVFLVGSVGIGWLAVHSVALQRLSRVANDIQIESYKLSVLEWKSFAVGRVSADTYSARENLDAAVRTHIGTLGEGREAAELSGFYDRYALSLDQEFTALTLNQADIARSIQRGTASSFDELADAADDVSASYTSAADRALAEAVVGSIAILLLGMVVIVSSFRRTQRAQAAADELFEHRAMHDALTGLPNRLLLQRHLEDALATVAGRDTAVALLLIGLDRLRDVNDTLGHARGDDVLVEIAGRLRAAQRPEETIARLAGDEFVVVLPDVVDIGSVLLRADGFDGVLQEAISIEGLDIDIEASIGVVMSDRDGKDAQTLFRHADVAMHAAKKRGQSIATYEPEVDASSVARLTMLQELRHAIDAGELLLHFQPKIGLVDHRMVGVEALVRWEHPQRGMVRPDQFIPDAERSALMGPLTRHVLDLALAQARRWIDAGHPLPVAVNVSARNLADDRLFDDVVTALATHHIPAAMLTVEITESAIVTDPERARDVLARLFELGVKLSIDDFGTGYTSLTQLKLIPIEELKIDRSFVATMTSDIGNAHIVEGIVALAHKLGLATVAEGVEDEETLFALREIGCDVAQGFLLARPMPAEAFDVWLRRFLVGTHDRAAS
jgi:diguanylate cyclase